jgi:hypothetical protein
MTRRLLILASLTAALLFSGVIADSPAPAAGAAMLPPRVSAADGPRFDVRLGDGIVQVRIRGCEACPTEVSIQLEFPRLSALVNP